jgi:DNA-binding transcriptional ArsR family regulator
MSIYKKTVENLFISKVRIKALSYFLLNPTRPLHLRGAVREFNEEINAVRRELTRLEGMKFLSTEEKGNRKYFTLNLDHPFISELMAIFHKTHGLGGEIAENIKKLGEVDYAFLTPAFTKGSYYGVQVVDLVIIGAVDMNQLSTIIRKQEDKLQKEIHYTVLTFSEFQLRRRRRDQFILDLMVQDLVMLAGKKEDLIKQV